jgi:hypothetical protein
MSLGGALGDSQAPQTGRSRTTLHQRTTTGQVPNERSSSGWGAARIPRRRSRGKEVRGTGSKEGGPCTPCKTTVAELGPGRGGPGGAPKGGSMPNRLASFANWQGHAQGVHAFHSVGCTCRDVAILIGAAMLMC